MAQSEAVHVWNDPGRGVRVYTHCVTNHGVVAGSEADAAPAFQRAIDAARDAGGGIVYAPAGPYTFRGNLVLHSMVTLQGDWAPPGAKPPRGRTLLRVLHGKGEPTGADFIRVKPGACLRDMTLHYPEQSFARPVPYAPAIGVCGNAAAVRLTLVNPYIGFRGVSSAITHYIMDCYGTPLHEGIWLDVCTDVGRILKTGFAPEYWESSGLPGAPAMPAERAALRAHLMEKAVGIRLGYDDGQHMTNVRVSGYRTGLWLTRRTDGRQTGLTIHSYGEASGVVLEDCGEALRCDDANHIVGWRFSSSRFAARDGAVVGTGSSTIQFAGCRFASDRGAAIRFPRKADLDVVIGFGKRANEAVFARTGMTFHACRFERWGSVAIEAISGKLSVTDCDFLVDKPAARLGKELVAATFVGNRFAGKPRIRSECVKVAFDHEPVQWDKIDLEPHRYAPNPRPQNDAIVDARKAHGAAGDGKADDTAAIQGALDAASGTGGTVFLEAGIYRCKGCLKVPPGVELRGVCGERPDHSFHTGGGAGTMLFAPISQDGERGDPFIRLGAKSGLRGLRIAYPGLFDTRALKPAAWSVRMEGADAYVMDVCLNNSSQGIEIRGDRSLVRNVLINAWNLAMRVDGCRDAVIEEVHVHPQFMAGLLRFIDPDAPTRGREAAMAARAVFDKAIAVVREQGTCFELGDCRGTRFVNPSTWPVDTGFRVVSPRAEAHILNCTLETHAPLWVEAADHIELINANAPVVGVRTGKEFAGKVHVVNYLLRTGHRGRQCLDLQGPGEVFLTQCWFKWIPAGGQEMLFKRGNLRLLGGMMVDVVKSERGEGRMSLTGTVANEKVFGPELRRSRAGVGVEPRK